VGVADSTTGESIASEITAQASIHVGIGAESVDAIGSRSEKTLAFRRRVAGHVSLDDIDGGDQQQQLQQRFSWMAADQHCINVHCATARVGSLRLIGLRLRRI